VKPGVKLDHLAVACTTLAEGTEWVEDVLGVRLQAGGQHARYGTHNTLLGLADGIYLEVIAIEPDAVPEAGHSWFGLDDFEGPPRLVNWVCQADDISAETRITGEPRTLTRGDLAWQITVPDDGSLPMSGAFPTFIRWAAGTLHPSRRLIPSGCRLVRFEMSHPNGIRIANMLDMDDQRIVLTKGAFEMRATFATPDGLRTL